MVSKITESVVGVAEYPAAEETMHAMTQAKANTSARPRTVCECRTRDRYGALVESPTRTAFAIRCSLPKDSRRRGCSGEPE